MLNILVIEDEETVGHLLKDILSELGPVDNAFGKDEAIKKILHTKFDLIIADYYLGESNTIEVLFETSELIKNIPVILMSGYANERMRNEASELNIGAFMPKPLNFDELFEHIYRLTAPIS